MLVEALVRLPANQSKHQEFRLRVPGCELIAPETLRPGDTPRAARVFFRIPSLQESTTAEFLCRDKSLGKVQLPVLSRAEFVENLSLQLPTVSVHLGRQSVACRSFVSTQSKGVSATILLTSPTALAPLADLHLAAEFRSQRQDTLVRLPVSLSASQFQSKQALVTVSPQPFPRRIGAWTVTWYLDERQLAEQQVRAVSKPNFERSLRVSDTRYIVEDRSGRVALQPQPPENLQGIARLGPCFLLSSSEAGMAGLCTMQTRAIVAGDVPPPILAEHEVLITDGPTPFVPGTLELADLEHVSGFELLLNGRTLGAAPMTRSPTANFSTEGGFQPTINYTWTAFAEDQLNERLAELLERES